MNNIFDIKDKVIIFTGSTGHLGLVSADHLESNGAIIIRTSRSEKNNKHSYKLDISDDTARKEFVEAITNKFGQIDGIVNNAYSGVAGEMHDSNRDEFEHSLDMNLTSPFLLIQDLFPYLASGSSIINISSMYGMVSPDPRIYGDSGANNPIYYGAGKAGLIQMTKYLACHLADKNIRVNSVSPGAFPNFYNEQLNGEFHKKLENKIPLGKIGQPKDLQGILHFLLSDASSYITGANIPVDGGWTAW